MKKTIIAIRNFFHTHREQAKSDNWEDSWPLYKKTGVFAWVIFIDWPITLLGVLFDLFTSGIEE